MEFFPYATEKRWAPILTPLGVRSTDGVTLTDDGMLEATFGWVSVRTPLTNIDRTAVTGPHKWFKAVGLRLSFSDDDLTFGTNPSLGLSIEFVERIPKVIGPRDHSALWVSVADPTGLAAAIGR